MFTQDRVVSMHPYFKVSEGKWSHFSELCQQLVSMAAMEPKCLYYGFSFNGSEAFCREAYDGAEGLLTHLESVATRARRVRQKAKGPRDWRGPMGN
jgi:hypothetical protein